MKIGFSTLGCPNWSFSEIISTASDLGFDGIEMRGVGSEIYMPSVRNFSAENAQETQKRLNRSKVEIVVFSSAADLGSPTNIRYSINEAQDYIDLAAEFKCKYVRVLADSSVTTDMIIDDEYVAKQLRTVCDYAKSKGVTILVESNGNFSDSSRLLNLISSCGADNVGVLWDIYHTLTVAGEKVEDTVKTLGKFIKHVHLKDAVLKDDGYKFVPVGDGVLPIKDALIALENIGFDGYVCLEWLKRWSMNLPEPGIIFPQYISYIRGLLNEIKG